MKNPQHGPAGHWTESYDAHGQVIYHVDADIYQNLELTRTELALCEDVASALGTPFRSPVLDLACGPGRHSIELVRRGYSVTGLDGSSSFLEIATTCARTSHLDGKLTFERGDLRALQVGDGAFPTVLLLGNSFGYFSDEENVAILREARRVLSPGGLLVLDLTHKQPFLEHLQAYSRSTVQTPWGLIADERWRSWDPATLRIRCRKVHTAEERGNVLLDVTYSIRLYEPSEVTDLLELAGFHASEQLGQLGMKAETTDMGLMQHRIFFGGLK